jgi:Mrp family chromosome partitioning ATPase
LHLLAAGPLPPNPAELLATDRVSELLNAVTAVADVVLIDAPALTHADDAIALATRVGGVVVVATADLTGRRDLARALDMLDDSGATTVGLVLNGVAGERELELLDVGSADPTPRVEDMRGVPDDQLVVERVVIGEDHDDVGRL